MYDVTMFLSQSSSNILIKSLSSISIDIELIHFFFFYICCPIEIRFKIINNLNFNFIHSFPTYKINKIIAKNFKYI